MVAKQILLLLSVFKTEGKIIWKADSLFNRAIKVVSLQTHSRSVFESTKPLGCCMVKPHGQLVQVSSMPRSTYTPCLSTS